MEQISVPLGARFLKKAGFGAPLEKEKQEGLSCEASSPLMEIRNHQSNRQHREGDFAL
jgi:hypothetical protein